MTREDNGPGLLNFFLVLALVVVALWFRFPRIGEGMPFFYREDEAHHYNRLVNMVKTGDLNPQYFHKPSLHFYLRIPAVAAGFLMGVRKGQIRSVKEIQTKDPYGIADYSFSSSHPIIAKSARTMSVFLSLILVAVTFLLTKELTKSIWPPLAAGFLVAVSPALIQDSAVIGVDILMTTMCLLTSFAAIRLSKLYSLPLLALMGVLAGLAVSSKYNALPIMLLPLIVILVLKKHDVGSWVVALLMPVLGFLLGSPFIISSIPLFLDQLGYEIWHYGVAAHEGHSAAPGLDQAMFYLNWLNDDALGPVATSLGFVGLLALFFRNQKQHLILASFPILFFLLMIAQKTNFTRNMLVIIPYVSIFSALALWLVLEVMSVGSKLRAGAFALFIVLAALMPVSMSLKERAEAMSMVDSRSTALQWLSDHEDPNQDTAVAGKLQFPGTLFQRKGYSRVDTDKFTSADLFQAGFDRLITTKDFPINDNGTEEHTIVGSLEDLRIVKDPTIKIIKLKNSNSETSTAVLSHYKASVGKVLECGSTTEKYCWLTTRQSRITLYDVKSAGRGNNSLKIKMMTPWPNQKITVQATTIGAQQSEKWSQEFRPGAGIWSTEYLPLTLSENIDELELSISIELIRSPKSQGLSDDERRLGVAIEQFDFTS